jgi:hypothetical protein
MEANPPELSPNQQSPRRVMMARVVLAVFVLGGLLYFGNYSAVDVDFSLRVPYRVVEADAEAGRAMLRRQVVRIDVVIQDDAGEHVRNASFFFKGGMAQGDTQPSRISLAPGPYIAKVHLSDSAEFQVIVERPFTVEDEGALQVNLE